jgi:chaperonin GroES
MGVKIQPLSDYVVAQDEKAESKTASGLYLPDSAKEKPKTAIVVAVGPDAKQVKVGDQIIYKTFSTTEIKIDREDYLLVKEEDVLATVKKDK